MQTPSLHLIVPGAELPGDWFGGKIPENVVAGKEARIDSSASFRCFHATGPVGLRVGNYVTIWGTSIAPERDAMIEIGDYCYLVNASLACSSRITIGSRVYIAGGVTIVDSDFHPLTPAARLFDTIALSPVGDKKRRIHLEPQPVVIEDDVWIGCNAVIMKGVHIGTGAVIAPGALVIGDVSPGDYVAGNPARSVFAKAKP